MTAQSFNAKLMKALQAMGNPVKDTKGHNYKYAQLDQVMDVIKPALAANGLAVRQGVKLEGGLLILETFVFDEGEELVMDTRTIEHMADPQKQGSYETYMRRYALLTVFGLAPEDDDGQAARTPQKRPAPTQGPAPERNTPDPLAAARQRLKTALNAHCEAHGIDPSAEIELLGGNQFIAKQDVAWLNGRADFYENN